MPGPTSIWWIGVTVAIGVLSIWARHLRLRRVVDLSLPEPGTVLLSNCLLWGLGQWWQRGGYVSLRQSAYWPGPHVNWSADLKTFYDFTPIKAKRKRWLPPLIFWGVVQRWEPPEP